jgi:hypothetical protein
MEDNSTLFVNQINCEGSEEYLLACEHLVTTDCGISQMAGVVCVEIGAGNTLMWFTNLSQHYLATYEHVVKSIGKDVKMRDCIYENLYRKDIVSVKNVS